MPNIARAMTYAVQTVILDDESGQEQVVAIETMTGDQWMSTRGTPLASADTGEAGARYRIELVLDGGTVVDSYETTSED